MFQYLKLIYDLEYGKDSIEIHIDSINKTDRVLIIDDLIATGGTANACVKMVQKLTLIKPYMGFFIDLVYIEKPKEVTLIDTYSIIKFL